MAANAVLASWGPSDIQRSTQIGYEAGMHTYQVPDTRFRGVSVFKNDDPLFTDVVKIPNNATLTTGVTIDFLIVDDGKDAADLGKGVVFGVVAKLLASGTDNLDVTSGAGAEVTGTVTLSATKGAVVVGSVAVPNANLDSAAIGGHVAVQVRRIGSNAADTCRGRIVLLKATAYAY